VVRICIVEDNRLSREGLTQALRGHAGLGVSRAVTTAGMASLAGVDPAPDVVVVHAAAADCSCLGVVHAIAHHVPGARVVVMGVSARDPEIAELVQAGVAGFILQEAGLGELIATVRAVAAGGRVLPTTMTAALFTQLHAPGVRAVPSSRNAPPMTQRERDVVTLIADGMSNKEIALHLHIATDTVKSHVRHVMDKLALRTRLQIAAYVHQQQP
jgi:DNA-binding NarL/FixJ family response regulator